MDMHTSNSRSAYDLRLLLKEANYDDTIETMNRPISQRQIVHRRRSLFFEERNLDDIVDKDYVWNQGGFDDTIGYFNESYEPFIEKERTLSLTMNFDINLYSSYQGGRRASIAVARRASEELDPANIAQLVTYDHTVNQSESDSKGERLSLNTPIIDSSTYFTGTMASYYCIVRRNLLGAIEKSTESRGVVEKMNRTKVNEVRKFLKTRVVKKSQPTKHSFRRY